MANLGRAVNNNNGSQMASLRAVSQTIDSALPKSELSDVKDKQLANDILSKLSEKLNLTEENLGEYLLELNSKSIDATLARIVDVVQKSNSSEFSDKQLASIKTLLAEYAAQKTEPEIKTEKQDPSEVISALQKMFAEQNKILEAAEAEGKTAAEVSTEKNEAEKPEDKDAETAYQTVLDKHLELAKEAQTKQDKDFDQQQKSWEEAVKKYVQIALDPKTLGVSPKQISEQLTQLDEQLASNLAVIDAQAALRQNAVDDWMTNVVTKIDDIQQTGSDTLDRIENQSPAELPAPAAVPEALTSEVQEQNVPVTPESSAPEADTSVTAQIASQIAIIDAQISELTTGILSNIQNSIAGTASQVLDAVQTPFEKLHESIAAAGTAVKDSVSATVYDVKESVKMLGQSVITSVIASIDNVGKKISEISTSVANVVTAPFRMIKGAISSIGKSLKDGFINVMAGVGSALKSVALAPLKAIGGMLSAINPFKCKKKKKDPMKLKLAQMIDKVNNFIDNFFETMLGYTEKFLDRVLKQAKKIVTKLMIHIFTWLLVNVAQLGAVLALVIPLIADPLMKIIQPILDFLAPIRDFLINTLSKIVDNIIIPLGKFILDVFKSIFTNVLEPLLKGIGTVAEALGKALGKLIIGVADFMVDTLLPFLRDHFLPAIGAILDVIKALFDGMKTYAFQIGEGLGRFVTAVVNVLADLMEGIRPHAKEIGEKLSEIVLEVADMILGLVKTIKPYVVDIINSLRLYVIAPLTGLKRKFTSMLVDLAEKFTIPVPIMDFHGSVKPWKWEVRIDDVHPFGFLTKGMDKITIDQAHADAEKPVSELINEEMTAMQDKIAEEAKQAEADALAQKMQQAKMQKMLEQVGSIDAMLATAEANHKMLSNISEAMDLEPEVVVNVQNEIDPSEISQPEISDANIKALQSAAATDTNEQVEEVQKTAAQNAASDEIKANKFNKSLMSHLNQMSIVMTNNFQAILDKLDNKPDLLPMPILAGSSNPNNLASMENFI